MGLTPLIAVLLIVVALACFTTTTSAAEPKIFIHLSVEPTHLYYPGTLPKEGYSFSELLFVNYSKSLANATIVIQFYNDSKWWNLTAFTANRVGFTQAYVPVTAYWAHSGDNTLRAITTQYTSNTATLVVTQNTDGFTVDGAIYAALFTATIALFLFARNSSPRRYMLAIIAVYLMLAPFTGQRYDVYFLISSGIRVLEHVNPFDPGQPPIYPFPLKWAYPPLYPLYSALSFLVYQSITHVRTPPPDSTVYPGYYTAVYSVWRGYVTKSMPLLVFLLKLPMIVSFIVTYRVLSRMIGGRSALKYWAANPLALLVCAVWGQLDPLTVALALLSLESYGRGKTVHAYVYSALGGAIKLWPAALIPIYLAQTLRVSGPRALKPAAAGVLPVVAVAMGVYGFFGHVAQSLEILVYARGVPTYAGQFSVNGLTWQWILYFLRSPPIPLFLVVGPATYVALLVYAYRRPTQDPTTLLIILILTVFLTYNYVNPQYFLWVVPLLVVQGRKLSIWVYTVLPLVFVGLSYNIFYFVSPAILYDTYAPSASIAEQLKLALFFNYKPLFVGVASVAPLVAYIWELRAQISRLRAPPNMVGGRLTPFRRGRGK